MIQKSEVIVILYESANTWRQIFLDGRELGNDFPPTFLGYSIGKWDGDTLVVDTRGFNGKTWLDQTGKPTSDVLHVTERFRRTDFGHMEIQITIEDPKVYTKPWTVKEQVRLMPNTDVIETPVRTISISSTWEGNSAGNHVPTRSTSSGSSRHPSDRGCEEWTSTGLRGQADANAQTARLCPFRRHSPSSFRPSRVPTSLLSFLKT
ncbi:MAG: hypothetical protein DMG13_32485 [Acidobacteria bacterium]|nr:MAG: hypothetical protein DMG13_32485 [Acidobacteriota bacterium]